MFKKDALALLSVVEDMFPPKNVSVELLSLAKPNALAKIVSFGWAAPPIVRDDATSKTVEIVVCVEPAKFSTVLDVVLVVVPAVDVLTVYVKEFWAMV